MNNEKKQTGRVNYVRVLAGGYLVYLAWQLFKGVFSGESVLAGVCGGVLFAAVGAWLLYREWKAYKFGAEHMDDPETWNDDPPEESALEEDKEIYLEDAGKAPEEEEEA